MKLRQQFNKVVTACNWDSKDDTDRKSAKKIVASTIHHTAFKNGFGWYKDKGRLFNSDGNELTLLELTPLLLKVAYMKGLAAYFIQDDVISSCYNMLKNRQTTLT